MLVQRTTKYLLENGITYPSGYNVRLTKAEFNDIVNHLERVKMYSNDIHLKTDITYGYNATNITTNKVILDYLKSKVEFLPFKIKANRYINFIIIDINKGFNPLKTYKGLEVGQEIIVNNSVSKKDTHIDRGSKFIVLDFATTATKRRAIRAISKSNECNKIYSFFDTEVMKR